MRGTWRTTKLLWRWRGNPLRRPDDVTEAWLVLIVWLLIAVAGTVVGMTTAHAAGEVFARQREERHPVRAVLLDDVPKSVVGTVEGRRSAAVRWPAADGSTRTGRALVDAGQRAGAT
ncbi:Rv1733c family protein, partial [Streptomyces sp. S6]